MSSPDGQQTELEEARATIQTLRDELDETSRGLLALTMELEQRIDARTDDLRQRAEQQEVVAQLAQEALASRDVAAVYDRAAELAATTLGAERSLVLELHRGQRQLAVVGSYGSPEQVRATTMTITSTTPVGRVLQQKAPLILENEAVAETYPTCQEHESPGVSTGVLVIIPGSTRPFGVLGVFAANEHTFQADELVFLEAMAGTLAGVAVRARAEASLRSEIRERQAAQEQMARLFDELKTSQSQLIQSAKMSAVGTMVAGVAHELNNPLTAILHFAEYCRDHTDPDDRLHGISGDIEHETRRCIRVVDNLLTFSRMDRGESRRSLALPDIIERVLRLLSYRLERLDIEVIAELTDSTPTILGSEDHLQQVVFNLVNNAIDAMHDSSSRTLTLRLAPEGQWIRLEVIDTGCGIPEAHTNLVLDPFFTTKPIGKGTGLGLSVSRSIVEAHYGTMDIRSTHGEGTTVAITLPRSQGGRDG